MDYHEIIINSEVKLWKVKMMMNFFRIHQRQFLPFLAEVPLELIVGTRGNPKDAAYY